MGRFGQVVALSLAHLNVRKWKMLSGAHSVLWWGLSRFVLFNLDPPTHYWESKVWSSVQGRGL